MSPLFVHPEGRVFMASLRDLPYRRTHSDIGIDRSVSKPSRASNMSIDMNMEKKII